MKGLLITSIGFIILTATLAAVSFVGMNKFASLKQTEIENEARFQCAQSSRYEVQQSKDVTVWYPLPDLYKKCLTEKGIK